MGPLLYSLLRFTKPRGGVLELGAGYTSLFLLQALEDNAAELRTATSAAASIFPSVPWLVDLDADDGVLRCILHCVDNMAHEHTSAHRVAAAAASLGLSHRLAFHDADALDAELPSRLAVGRRTTATSANCRHFGCIWLDLGAGPRLRALVDAWWPRLEPAGGIMAVHSTLTNDAGRAWVARMRAAQRAGDDAADGVPLDAERAALAALYGRFEVLSLLEPHKRFQNSVTLLRRRGGGAGAEPLWDEPVYSKWP